MKSVTLLLLIVASICVLSGANRPRSNCPTICTQDYKPVCAILRRGRVISACTFSNRCALNRQQCVRKQNWILINTGKCPSDSRDCPTFLRPL
ncbi:vasotab-like [Drosophila mojavensis]|uniref:vasotab-like n=1 Tax=Drosophila mojavensis TaxID=7230 RepID=UPI001CD16E85|nr:vasotab-like [Drosophila mojavensis]